MKRLFDNLMIDLILAVLMVGMAATGVLPCSLLMMLRVRDSNPRVPDSKSGHGCPHRTPD